MGLIESWLLRDGGMGECGMGVVYIGKTFSHYYCSFTLNSPSLSYVYIFFLAQEKKKKVTGRVGRQQQQRR